MAVFAIRRRVGDLFRGAGITVGILLVTLVVTFTIDLGRVFGGLIKGLAEAEASKFLERPLHLGRLGIQIAPGPFRRRGRADRRAQDAATRRSSPRSGSPSDFPWWQVFNTRELFIRSVEMSDWTMQIEKFEQGNSLPQPEAQDEAAAEGRRRFTTTLQYLHAYRGAVHLHRPQHVERPSARNLDIYVRHDTGEYLGTASPSATAWCKSRTTSRCGPTCA